MSFIIGDVVTIDYNDLISKIDLKELIFQAFSEDGLGLLTVKNVPGFVEARSKLLPLSHKFASLPDEVKEKYSHPESFYSFGWSHGKEKLQGVPDKSKGSYYANPQYDRPIEDVEIISKFPSFIHPNIWPKDDLPELESAFKDLGQLIVSIGKLVAYQCDQYVHSVNKSYPNNKLENIISKSLCCKARLLHYYAKTNDDINEEVAGDLEFSSWCGWHNDHGSLTGLTSALFLDKDGNPAVNTDQNSGLYIRNRKSELVKISIPSDHIAFQIGETAQIHSGGILQATPHAVRGSSIPYISRETFAVFMEPNFDEPMNYPDDIPLETVQSQSAAINLPPGVPTLRSRWNPSQNFGEFTDATLKSYH